MSAHVSASVAIYGITAEDIKVTRGVNDERYSQEGIIWLHVTEGGVWLTLGAEDGDLAAEAAALRKLAEVATELAAELEQRAGGAS